MSKGPLDKRHGATAAENLSPNRPSPESVMSAGQKPETIKLYDKSGREFLIKKGEWSKTVLPGAIHGAWNNPSSLYGVIVGAFKEGLLSETLSAAKRLTELEPDSPRAACTYGIALMKTGHPDEAERLLTSYVADRGEDGTVLTNLAKVYAAKGDDEQAGRTLCRALEVDPNQDNGLSWFWALAREQGGDSAGVLALGKVAAFPSSWRPQLWLARIALQSGQINEALKLYRLSLDRMGASTPADGLTQISGDLGKAGLLKEMLQLCLPRFVAKEHGLTVGNNLIKASIEVGQLDQAKRILEQLFKLQRPDWEQPLKHWNAELAGARIKSD